MKKSLKTLLGQTKHSNADGLNYGFSVIKNLRGGIMPTTEGVHPNTGCPGGGGNDTNNGPCHNDTASCAGSTNSGLCTNVNVCFN